MELKLANRTYRYPTPQVMGIVNITPDSFYAGSRYSTLKEVYAAIYQMIDDGAAFIDIGAASSRPGAIVCTVQQEWERLSPVLRALRPHFPDTLISIDTFYSKIVEWAYDLIGPFMINDISGGENDPNMFSVAARLKLPVIAMYNRGTLQNIQYYFASTLERAKEAGIQQIILDPGFGFAKTTEQNYTLLTHLSTLLNFPGVPTLIGLSRKSMIYKPLGISPDEALPATSALHLYALQQGVDILRVHDVAQANQMIRIHALLK